MNAGLLNFLSIKESWQKSCDFHKILSRATVINFDNNKTFWAPTQHFRKISEGSCDTEDWSNDAENLALQSQE